MEQKQARVDRITKAEKVFERKASNLLKSVVTARKSLEKLIAARES